MQTSVTGLVPQRNLVSEQVKSMHVSKSFTQITLEPAIKKHTVFIKEISLGIMYWQ